MAANTEMARLDSVPAETLEKMISGADNQLPKVTSTDNGKALIVKSGKWAKQDIPSQLPEVTADDNGKVLMVVDGEWAVASLTPDPDPVPGD